jgi:uncharacterized membrane protein (DUF485 family)
MPKNVTDDFVKRVSVFVVLGGGGSLKGGGGLAVVRSEVCWSMVVVVMLICISMMMLIKVMMVMMMMTLVRSFRQVYGSLNAAAGMKTWGIPIACVLVAMALMMMAVPYCRGRRSKDDTVSRVVKKSEADTQTIFILERVIQVPILDEKCLICTSWREADGDAFPCLLQHVQNLSEPLHSTHV